MTGDALVEIGTHFGLKTGVGAGQDLTIGGIPTKPSFWDLGSDLPLGRLRLATGT